MKKILRTTLLLLFLVTTAFFLYSNSNEKPDRKALNLLIWGGAISTDAFTEFTKETNIPVNISYYASNEELITKLRTTKGKGYDLILPSDYGVSMLRQYDLLQPLDKSKLNFIDQIDPFLTGHPFDPNNEYSVPYIIDILGFGIDSKYFKEKKLTCTWHDIFKNPPFKIGVGNDPIEHFNLAAFYLYGKIDNLTDDEIVNIEKLLIKQKSWVETFTAFRAEYILATKSVPLALGQSSEILNALKYSDDISFILPERGTFISIESFCLPKETQNQERAYKLINYLYQHHVLKQSADLYNLFPAIPLDDSRFHKTYLDMKRTMQRPGYKVLFFKHTIPEDKIRRLWINIKS